MQRRQKYGKKVAVNCPDVFLTYNDMMGGVDLSDQKVSLYDFNRKSLKWWKKVFHKLLMTSVVNSLIIFQTATNSKSPLKPFIVELAEQLITKGRSTAKVTRRTSQTVGPRSKRSKMMLNIGDHMPVNSEGRRRCARCSQHNIDKRTTQKCAACEVPLCQKCFTPYHN